MFELLFDRCRKGTMKKFAQKKHIAVLFYLQVWSVTSISALFKS